MIRSTTALTFALCSLLAASTPAHALEVNWAEEMFSELEHKFGVVARGAETKTVVKIKNLYKQDVNISSVRTSCSCTIASVNKRNLKSLETAELTISIDTKRFMRQKNTQVIINFSSPRVKEVRIPISVYIRTDVVLTPGAADFGRVDKGAAKTKTIDISYAGRADWKITGVEASQEFIDAKVVETRRQNNSANYKLSVTLKDDAPIGDLRGKINLLTDDQNSPKVPVLVEATVEPDIVITPGTVSLGMLTPGIEKTVRIVVRGKEAFSIEKIECASDTEAFKHPPLGGPKKVHVIPITVAPPAQPGDLTEEFTMTIAGRTDTVSFKAYGKILGN